MSNKWNNEFFAQAGLYGFDFKITTKSKKRIQKQIEKRKKQGKEYYTKDRLMKIKAAQALVSRMS